MLQGPGETPIQIVRSNTALDPVGVCLALEGRLNSTDSREALAGALRQASGEGRCANSSSSSSGQSARIDSAASHGQPVSAGAPTCLSAQAHQLSGDCLSAFAAAAVPAGDDEDGVDDASRDKLPPVPTGGSYGAGLTKQDTVHPAALVAASSANTNCGNGSTAGPASSAPQRSQGVAVTAAIERTSTAALDANGGIDHGAGTHDPLCTCPPYAVKSTCGKRPNMEDTYALCPNICELPMSPMSHEYADKLPHRIAVQFETQCQEFPRDQATAMAAVPGLRSAQQLQQQLVQPQQPVQPPQQQHSNADQQQQLRQQQQQQPQQSVLSATAERAAAAFAGAAQLPEQLGDAPEGENSVSSLSSSSDGGLSVEKLHFFGVYDGHGGIEASAHCAQRLHYHLSKAVAEMASMWLINNAGEEAAGPWNPEVRYAPLDTARVDETSPGECFLSATTSADETAANEACGSHSSCSSLGLAACSSSSSSSNTTAGLPAAGISTGGSAAGGAGGAASAPSGRGYGRTVSGGSGNAGNDSELDSNEGSSGDSSDTSAASFSGMMEEVLRDAFIKTDEEFSDSGLQAGLVGSTAVVALVGTHRVWIANCGDSRAVLSRGGRAIQVTDDHKPEREDEAERVEKAGGQVLYWNGHRVMGVLAMSRAIGDHCLRPYVIPEPEISVFARHTRDELLLLASDGLWDVLSNQEATDLALRSIKRAREKGASRKAAARVAATVLTKAAVDRGSRDNITVVIIDLSPPPTGGDKPEKASAAAAAAAPDSSSTAEASQQQQVQVAEGPALQQAPAASGPSRPPSSGRSSNSSSRQASVRHAPTRSGSSGISNPFAAAAASPFSTAATGSSELPLPPCAAHLADAPAAAGSVDRSARSSAAGGSSSSKLPAPNLSGPSGSAFASAAAIPAAVSTEMSSCFSNQAHASGLATELDSLDLSGAAAVRGHGSKDCMQQAVEASSAAGNSSTASSQLEEQPTIVDPPPDMPKLYRQPSSSPFSTCQGPAFGDA